MKLKRKTKLFITIKSKASLTSVRNLYVTDKDGPWTLLVVTNEQY